MGHRVKGTFRISSWRQARPAKLAKLAKQIERFEPLPVSYELI